MLVASWKSLWDKIVSLYDLEEQIKYNVEDIKSITRGDDVEITYVRERQL